MTGLGLCVWSYKVMHSWWPLLLGMGACGRGQSAHPGLPASTNNEHGTGQQKAQGTPRSTSTCWLPFSLSHWRSLWQCTHCVRQILSHLVGWVWFTRLTQIQTQCECWVWGHSLKVSGYTKVSRHHPVAYRLLQGGRVSGTHQDEASRVYLVKTG